MKKILLIIALFWGVTAQAQLTFTAPVAYWTGVPNVAPSTKGSRIAANLLTNKLYQWDSTNLTWDLVPFGIDEISGTAAPAYVPGIGDSPFAINKKIPNPELYYYFSGSWHLVGGAGGGSTYTAGEGIDITADVISIDTLDRLTFNTAPVLPGGLGILQWNDTDGTLELGLKGGTVTLQIGQETLARAVNKSGTTITNGQVVYISGAQGNRIKVGIASAASGGTTNTVLGIATEAIANNDEGYITTEGLVRGLNTSAFAEGAPLYLSPSVPGGITATMPTAPDHAVVVGYCVRQHATVGIIYVTVTNGEHLSALHDVKLTSPANGQVLAYDSVNGWWENSAVGSVIDWPLLAPNGSAEAPSYSFATSPGSGVYYDGALRIATPTETITSGKSILISAGGTSVDEDQGGVVTITGGSVTGVDAIGGGVGMQSGSAPLGNGGAVSIQSGSGISGGQYNLIAGSGTTGQGGNYTMLAGNSVSGAGGGFTASAGSGAFGGAFNLTAGDGEFGGAFSMRAGNSTADGEAGGGLDIRGGDGNGVDGFGGTVIVKGGSGSEEGGGSSFQGGDGLSGANGGSATIQGGTSFGGGNGGNVNISPGNGAVNGKIVMTGNGVVLPTLTTTQRNALTGVSEGTTIYNSTTSRVQAYLSGVWQDLRSTGTAITQTNTYATAQTNTALSVPVGAVSAEILVIGAGGGGGSGRKGAAASIRCGGGGGGSGGYSSGTFSIADLGSPATLYVTVGAGGTSGAAQATNSTNGNAGGAGGQSYVATTTTAADRFIQGNAGNGGAGGTAAAGGGGSAGTTGLSQFIGIAGGSASASGGVGGVGGTGLSGSGGGGGAGGGITTANAAISGGAGGTGTYSLQAGGTAGAIATNGNPGANSFGRTGGSGGGGGGSSLVGTAGSGGAGGAKGGGAGGGGAAVDSVGNSGVGGVGGAGYVSVTFYF